MKIDVYLDQSAEPVASFEPPDKFTLDTSTLVDGPHTLRFMATDADGVTSIRETAFTVRNGPGIAVHGIRDNDIVAGEIDILANAYSSKVGDIFEPMRIETPAPIPTWAWLLFLTVFAWGMWYLGIEFKEHDAQIVASMTATKDSTSVSSSPTTPSSGDSALGAQVFGNNCASCHQISGIGLPGLFPPLKGNPAVIADDATDHLKAVLFGLQGRVIDGTAYPAPMPSFAAVLSDDEIAAVINHERTSWGNSAPPVTAKQVLDARQ